MLLPDFVFSFLGFMNIAIIFDTLEYVIAFLYLIGCIFIDNIVILQVFYLAVYCYLVLKRDQIYIAKQDIHNRILSFIYPGIFNYQQGNCFFINNILKYTSCWKMLTIFEHNISNIMILILQHIHSGTINRLKLTFLITIHKNLILFSCIFLICNVEKMNDSTFQGLL